MKNAIRRILNNALLAILYRDLVEGNENESGTFVGTCECDES